jgi:hypothetical protein
MCDPMLGKTNATNNTMNVYVHMILSAVDSLVHSFQSRGSIRFLNNVYRLRVTSITEPKPPKESAEEWSDGGFEKPFFAT